MTASGKDEVRAHWEADPCGAKLAAAEPGTAEFFEEVAQARDHLEPFIAEFAEFDLWRGREVLEVGVGLGSDFVRFVEAGAHASGVDLTETSVGLVRRRLELAGLDASVRIGDAEELPFPDESFDLVYSWGVLHHTPDTHRALGEVRRVLRPGGEARIMLYSRRSWVAYGLWARYALAVGRPQRTLADVVANHMESPGTKAYTSAELDEMFEPFSQVRIRRFITPYDRRVAGPLAVFSPARLGWFVGIIAVR
jgi:ubiquinone/menaquinone biosynthesis C-methylase UbiE